MDKYIQIKGARSNNLKNIDVEIPRNKFVVITGLSGSGKSSLVFDTLYAEGQRRYVESLSSYARQFLGRMKKPEVDFIKGIPPAIAIEQKVSNRNARSTVGTSTEIYDYLRLLYARIGKTFSPVSGEPVKRHTVEDVLNYILTFSEGSRFYVTCDKVVSDEEKYYNIIDSLINQGFDRILVKGKVERLETIILSYNDGKDIVKDKSNIRILIDRLVVKNDEMALSRIRNSVETAFNEGNNACQITFLTEDGQVEKEFSNRFEADGMVFAEPTDQMFSFNSAYGACPVCEGYGKVMGIDEDLVVPNKALSIYEDAIYCWRGQKMGEWKKLLVDNASKFDFPVFRPWYELTEEQKKIIWTGNEYFHGLNEFFDMLKANQYKIQYRVMFSRYRGKTTCPECNGKRLKKEASYVKIGGQAITDLVDLPIVRLRKFFDELELDANENKIAKRLLLEINNRLRFLDEVGLGYLTLNRVSSTLSGGESQRINLATSLGSSLVGSLYILDEPSIGLHSRDSERLIKVLRELQALGNTVVVVEHDEDIIRAADYIIDIGPEAGRFGGTVVYKGDLSKALSENADNTKSYTVKYLKGAEKIPVPRIRRKWNNYIEVYKANKNNLKGINVKFPLNVLSVVTGVSGSGKSTLVREVFYKALSSYLDGAGGQSGSFTELKKDVNMVSKVVMVDQRPIGKSSRSNPVTYIKAYDEIRKLFSSMPLSKQMGYTPAFFSFNAPGGRCDECNGEGTVTVPMQFMADIVLPCEACHGTRFKKEILDVKYRGKSIYDVLNMSVNEAVEFFGESLGATEEKITGKLGALQDVGLGYIKLGQSSSTLSGGENQRVKLASFLKDENDLSTVYIFDEPSTGLHFHDIKILMKSLNALVDKGNTVIIIEHNMHIIKLADYIIDLGPEGGENGGNLVFAGTPEDIVNCKESYTGKYLKKLV